MTAQFVGTTALQVAFISKEKYAQGGIIPVGDRMGIVKGRSHAQGGHKIYIDDRPIGEIEGDELLAIVNKHDTRRIAALSDINSVHGHRFAQGGIALGPIPRPVLPYGYSKAEAAYLEQRIEQLRQEAAAQVEAINNRIDNLRVVVVEHDITEAQGNVKKVQVKSSF